MQLSILQCDDWCSRHDQHAFGYAQQTLVTLQKKHCISYLVWASRGSRLGLCCVHVKGQHVRTWHWKINDGTTRHCGKQTTQQAESSRHTNSSCGWQLHLTKISLHQRQLCQPEAGNAQSMLMGTCYRPKKQTPFCIHQVMSMIDASIPLA